MRAILVAGGAGYIGAHTCKALLAAGFLPVTLDNLSTGHSVAVKYGPFINAHINDETAIAHLVNLYDIKAAIHFAAFSLVGESITNPYKYYENNMAAATKFTSIIANLGVEHLVFSSTAAVYGDPIGNLINEDHPKNPINPYGASKLAFENALPWFERAHGLKSVILRYFNAAGADFNGEIGEDHTPETHLIPLVCKAAMGNGSALNIYGNDYDTPDGTPIRDYIHVNDLAQAHICAIEYLLSGGKSDAFNVGTGAGVSVKQVIETAAKIYGREIPHVYAPRRIGDPAILVADSGKIKKIFNWQPKHSDIETIIDSAKNWHASTSASNVQAESFL